MLANETLMSFQLPLSDPSFLYSEVESISAGIVTAIQSICGTILNFLVILALIRSEEIRKEYFTPTIKYMVLLRLESIRIFCFALFIGLFS